MKNIAQLAAALLGVVFASAPPVVKTALVHPHVLSGMEIQIKDNQVTVQPGICRIGESTVKVDKPATLTIAASESIPVVDEEYQLTSEPTQMWAGGTHLRGCTGSTALPDCLVPGTVVVKLKDGSVMEEAKDYRLDTKWAGLSRIEVGRIAADAKVKISYRIGQTRLDGINVAKDGAVSLASGKPAKTCPHPPDASADVLRLANVFVPAARTAVIEPWQVFVISDDYPEPDENATSLRAALVSKTLTKLRRGQAVTIVAWGDSVTAGGEASTPEKAFPQAFATQLGKRFPKAQVKLVNAGIGGTTTSQRLPNLQKDVLSHQPDLVTIEFVNDMGLDEATVRSNLENAFQQIRAAGAEIILCTPHFTMPQWMGHNVPRGKETRPMVKVLKAVASEQSVALADVSARWEHLEKDGLPYTTLLVNGINHPDDRGHELFVKELMTFFPAEGP